MVQELEFFFKKWSISAIATASQHHFHHVNILHTIRRIQGQKREKKKEMKKGQKKTQF